MDSNNFTSSLTLFGDLDSTTAQDLLSSFEGKRLLAGETLFSRGDMGDALYLVQSGSLCIHDPSGQACADRYIGPKEFVGEMSLLNGEPHRATVTVEEDSSLLRLSRLAFERLAEVHPVLVNRLVNALLPRFQDTQSRQVLTEVFGALDDSILCDLQRKIGWSRVECGEVLCRQGEPGNEMFIVVQGRLRFAIEENGEKRDVGEVGAGESVGEFALLAEKGTPESLRSATVYATRSTDVIVITRQVFEELVGRQSQILLKMTRRVIQREMRIAQSAPPNLSAQVIVVLPARPGLDISGFTRKLADALGALGPTLFFTPDRFDESYGKPGSAQTPLDHPTSLLINAWLDERERQHRFAIYDASPALDEMGHLTPWAQRSVEDADTILLVAEESDDPSLSVVEVVLTSVQTRARLELALLHPDDCKIPRGTANWLDKRHSGEFPVQAHYHVRLGVPADIRRMARRLGGCPVGLALGGGGARGWAHIGAIRAIEEAGLEVDYVGGASMGAVIASAYALDWPVDGLTELAVRFSDPKKLLDYTFLYASITSTRKITAMLQDFCQGASIEDTWRPFFCISANLTRGEEQVHSSGLLWKAVRPSMAFPAVFAPVLDDGCILIDGGAVNNLPIDRMRQLCPTGTVIGVDMVTDSPTNGKYNFGDSLSGWQAALGRLLPFYHKVKAPDLLDIVGALVYSTCRKKLLEVQHCADLIIPVPVEQFGLLDFAKYAEVIDLGYQAAKEALVDFKPQ